MNARKGVLELEIGEAEILKREWRIGLALLARSLPTRSHYVDRCFRDWVGEQLHLQHTRTTPSLPFSSLPLRLLRTCYLHVHTRAHIYTQYTHILVSSPCTSRVQASRRDGQQHPSIRTNSGRSRPCPGHRLTSKRADKEIPSPFPHHEESRDRADKETPVSHSRFAISGSPNSRPGALFRAFTSEAPVQVRSQISAFGLLAPLRLRAPSTHDLLSVGNLY